MPALSASCCWLSPRLSRSTRILFESLSTRESVSYRLHVSKRVVLPACHEPIEVFAVEQQLPQLAAVGQLDAYAGQNAAGLEVADRPRADGQIAGCGVEVQKARQDRAHCGHTSPPSPRGQRRRRKSRGLWSQRALDLRSFARASWRSPKPFGGSGQR